MDRKYIRYIFLLFLLFLTGSCLQASDSRKGALAKAEDRLRLLMAEWQSAHSITLDARLFRDLTNEFAHAQIVFAHAGDPGGEIRAQQFEKNSWLSHILNQHLRKMTSNPERLKTFFARLGEGLNINPERSGWPSTKPNNFVYKDFSDELPNHSYLLISEGLPSEAGYVQTRRFILGPGGHVIRSKGGKHWEFDVKPPARIGENGKPFPTSR